MPPQGTDSMTCYPKAFRRTIGSLKLEDQQQLENNHVAVYGYGGLGEYGQVRIQLSGADLLRSDFDYFDSSNV